MKQFTPEEFWDDLVAGVRKNGDLILDTAVVKSHSFVDGDAVRFFFEDEDGPDSVTLRKADIAEGNYMRQGEDGGALAWSFETPKGSFTLRMPHKRIPMPSKDGAELTGLDGKYTNGREGPYAGVAGTTVTVDYHNMLLFEVVGEEPQAVFHVSDAKKLADILSA